MKSLRLVSTQRTPSGISVHAPGPSRRLKFIAGKADLRRIEPNAMSHQSEHHSVRRVVLPSGRTIEVVYFDERAPAGVSPAHAVDRVDGLHVCPCCDSDLVAPTEWEEAGPDHWEVMLHCPNCTWEGGGIFEQELVERFDEVLDRGTEALVRDLQRLMRANMEDEVDRFVAALEADQIWPMDF
jgi:hypothetical protein